jgi:predicted transcriptional regulator
MISLLIMKRKSIHPMELEVSFHRMNVFYISLLTMKSSKAFGTAYAV